MSWKLGKFLKKVAVLFLWLAMTIIMAHAVIPHDHHSEISTPDTSCNAHENGADRHNPLPVHCHAFNDLVCEKFTFSFFKIRNASYNYLPLLVQLCTVTATRTGRLVIFYDGHFTLAGSELAASVPFRAPPFFI
jgi:hypothetical protein